jgi:hypothetical protein
LPEPTSITKKCVQAKSRLMIGPCGIIKARD